MRSETCAKTVRSQVFGVLNFQQDSSQQSGTGGSLEHRVTVLEYRLDVESVYKMMDDLRFMTPDVGFKDSSTRVCVYCAPFTACRI